MANFNINKVIIGGRLTADPEVKQTPSGVSVASFSVAVSRKVGKEKEPATDFLNVVAWRGTADFVGKYFHKGSSICVVGSLQVRKWQDKDGGTRYSTEIIADEINFVDGKNEQGGGSYVPDAYSAPKMEEVDADEDLPFN